MKIIGKTENGFILEAHRDEIANLTGFYYARMADCRQFEVGDAIDVAGMYKQLYDLQRAKGQLSEFAAQIRNVADLLVAHDPLVKAVIEKC